MKKYDNINWNELVKEYVETNISLTKMSEKYNIGRWTLTDRFKKLGVDIVNRQNEVKFNNKIFDKIDTEEKAYWLGFIYADGYIDSTRNLFEISLKGSDKSHLDKFNIFMEHKDLNHTKLGKAKCGEIEYERCRWSITDKHLWNVLNSYGCTPNKSLTLKFPDENIFADYSLIRHFIRGYFDGDGCFSRHINPKNVFPVVSIIGTPEFLDSIKSYINIECFKGKDKRWKRNTEYLRFNKKEGIDFINYIYSNCSIYLDRKYKLFNFFKNGSRLPQEWSKLLQTENGEVCDGNPVLSSETKESEPV